MKKKLASQSGFFDQRFVVGLFFVLAGLFLALIGVAEGEKPSPSAPASAGQVAHVTLAAAPLSGIAEHPFKSLNDVEIPEAPATRSTFMAKWDKVPWALGYRLDVSTNNSFTSYVSGYQDLDVGNVRGRVVTGLSRGTTYYYRVRGYDAVGPKSDSSVMTATTVPTGGLTINPTFEDSILGNPNAAAIQAVINQAISALESLFSDSVNVSIFYRYTTVDDPCGPVGGGTLAQSCTSIYFEPWSDVINALVADATTANDATANATLPGAPLDQMLTVSSANGRAIGFSTAGGTVINGMMFDATITINSNQNFQFTRPPDPDRYDLLRTVEHEMDEVLGLGSGINRMHLRPQDLFSYSSPGVRNTTQTGTRYFSIDNGNNNIVGFNQESGGDFGDWFSENCPQVHTYVQNANSCPGQVNDVTATSPEGINIDVIGWNLRTGGPTPTPGPTATPVSPTPTPGGSVSLGNLSTRLVVQTGASVLIGGLIITGTQPKPVILRAIGPSLPLAGVLADPRLELYDSSGNLLAFNDNWKIASDGTSQQAQVVATTVPPSNDLESALVGTLAPNNAYTLIVRGNNNGTGIGVVEAYDLNRTVDSRLANIATRGFIDTGNNVMIGGTIIVGNGAASVLFRAIGPSLANQGVPNAISDTTLELRDTNGGLIAYNDDWQFRPDGSSQAAEIQNTGLAPTHQYESALLRTLAPAAYTAIVRGYDDGQGHVATGVGLVEAYQLQ